MKDTLKKIIPLLSEYRLSKTSAPDHDEYHLHAVYLGVGHNVTLTAPTGTPDEDIQKMVEEDLFKFTTDLVLHRWMRG